MKRRAFIAGLGGAAAWPLVARAQQSPGLRRIGILLHGVQTDPLWQKRLAAFREELEGLGWRENRNLHIELRDSAKFGVPPPALRPARTRLQSAIRSTRCSP